MRILIVEDEPTLGQQLKTTLEQTGYAVDLSTDGEDGHFLGSTEDYDAVILDLGLPEIDGLSVLGMWRKEGRDFPVLVLTARDSWSDKVAGLDAGADDYLAKPFQTEELIARLRALIRRSLGTASSQLTHKDITLDTTAGKVTVNGEPVELTALELRMAPRGGALSEGRVASMLGEPLDRSGLERPLRTGCHWRTGCERRSSLERGREAARIEPCRLGRKLGSTGRVEPFPVGEHMSLPEALVVSA